MSRSTEIATDDPVPVAPLARWLDAHVDEVSTASGTLRADRIAGGHSNLTYRIVDDAGASWALRRPPMGGVLATAHDMSREWRFISALHPTPVPVARPVAYCADTDVIGAEFYVMGFVEGAVLGDDAAGAAYPEVSRHAAGLATVDVLADLHAVDPDEAGLGDLHRPGSYLQRQLKRWHKQAHASAVEDLTGIDAVHDLLVAAAPEATTTRIAHGDFRAGNLMYAPDGEVRAVLDWELATLGDPLADLGWLLMSWTRPGDAVPAGTNSPSAQPGFPERDELVARYVERTGTPLAGDVVDYYVAFARWRSACIGAGVYWRYVAGHMGPGAEQGAATATRLEVLQAQVDEARRMLGG
ncbi:acyl-CoA dehydrogenase [Pseudonocardia sulfidoxydans NBRC 16205]|uniref:Acyl-CoA dehydrogenase n=1 Tax=Pseudonocardia sulfidoxydans NBRC 16205 TaxID=1223511 RepID=A0A511DDH1_9PSEU|nr:phosphotransferase family protein [Pseudonocardia sulfidoxydans]GEL22860.1 acyl-CoA dehydrogenase [Pseudonocardia sulfidoxydans NBRC 16205]